PGAEITAIITKVPDTQVMSDLDATAAWAHSTGFSDSSRVAVVGFGWGGRVAWLYAAHNPSLRGSVAWYGHFNRPPTELQQRQPLGVVSELKAPVLGLYGGHDGGIPLSEVETMRAAIKEAGKDAQIIIFPEAPHGFNADYRVSYRAEAAQSA